MNINIIGKLVYLTSYLNENMQCEDSFIQQTSMQHKVTFHSLKIKEGRRQKNILPLAGVHTYF